MSALIIVVNANRMALLQTEALLSSEGHFVLAVPSFLEAKELLDSVSPELLIADVRLDEFNGLHLAAHSRLDHPSLPVIITHASPDPVLERDANRLGATFVVKPLEDPDFARRVAATLREHHSGQSLIRRWPRKRVTEIVEAKVNLSAAQVVDMSYGGLRLVFQDPLHTLAQTFEVTVPACGLTLPVHRVWTGPSPTGDDLWCGAEIDDAAGGTSDQWREFVDSV